MVGARLIAMAMLALVCTAARAQESGQPADPQRTAGIWGSADPNRGVFLRANCRHPPPAGAPFGGGARSKEPPPFHEVSSSAIPGVIAAGRHWRVVWEDPTPADSGDGFVAFDDGSVWLAIVNKSEVLKVDQRGTASVLYTDTYTGGALAANAHGQVFIAERALGNAVWMLRPRRRLLANTYHGEPFDCVGRFINDIVADGKGGVYMTMDGIYYINPKGVVSGPFGTVPGNGLMLSPDEKTFYATGRLASDAAGHAAGGIYNAGLVAYDVQPDGSLTHERQIAEICGDGLAVDATGRIYCTLSRVPDRANPTRMISGIGVVSPGGKVLGIIAEPRALDTVAFGGPDKKTLFAGVGRPLQLIAIQMIAQGNTKRPK